MAENEKPKEQTQEEQMPSLVSSAYEAVKKLQEENARIEANIRKLEELKAFEILGGKTEASQKEKPKIEMSDKDYAQLALEGKLPVEQ